MVRIDCGVQVLLICVATAVSNNPAAAVALRLLHPWRFPAGVTIELPPAVVISKGSPSCRWCASPWAQSQTRSQIRSQAAQRREASSDDVLPTQDSGSRSTRQRSQTRSQTQLQAAQHRAPSSEDVRPSQDPESGSARQALTCRRLVVCQLVSQPVKLTRLLTPCCVAIARQAASACQLAGLPQLHLKLSRIEW